MTMAMERIASLHCHRRKIVAMTGTPQSECPPFIRRTTRNGVGYFRRSAEAEPDRHAGRGIVGRGVRTEVEPRPPMAMLAPFVMAPRPVALTPLLLAPAVVAPAGIAPPALMCLRRGDCHAKPDQADHPQGHCNSTHLLLHSSDGCVVAITLRIRFVFHTAIRDRKRIDPSLPRLWPGTIIGARYREGRGSWISGSARET